MEDLTIMKSKWKFIIAGISLFAILAIIWILPIKAWNLSVQILLEEGHNGENVEWTVNSESSYIKYYTQKTYIYNNQTEVIISSEFSKIDSIEVSDDNVINDIVGVNVYSGNHDDVKYKVASYEGSCTTDKLIEIIEDGYSNPWRIQLGLSILVIFIYAVVGIFFLIKLKFSKYKAFGVCAVIVTAAILSLWINYNFDNYTKSDNSIIGTERVEISDGTVMTQQFNQTKSRLKSVGVYLIKEEDSDCDVIIQLVEKSTDTIVSQKYVTIDDISINGAYVTMNLSDTIKESGGIYDIVVFGINNKGEGKVSVFTSDTQTYGFEDSYINGEDSNLYMSCSLTYQKFYNVQLAQVIVLIFAILIIPCIIFTENSKFTKPVIIGIYVFMLLFSIFKMVIYERYVANTPDEAQHIGYIAYLESTDKIIPDFSEMKAPSVIFNDNKTMLLQFSDDSLNYLGHPPLYYNIMRMANAVTLNEDGTIAVNLFKIRACSMAIMVLTMLLAFYIGFTRLKKATYIHLLYAVICTSVPMLMYSASGVSNDTLAALTVTIFLLGIIRFVEKKRNIFTYVLIALGIVLSLLTKMTAGCLVAFTAVFILAFSCIKEKSIKENINYRFYVTIPIYGIALLYYAYIYHVYGTLQPGIFSLESSEYAVNTSMYTLFENRTFMSVAEYVKYFIDNFFRSWSGIASHIALYKNINAGISTQTIFYISLWFIPLIFACKKFRDNNPKAAVILCGYSGLILTLIIQFRSAYSAMALRGYLGGFQSRYYLCAIAVFALAPALAVEKSSESISTDNNGKTIKRIIITAAILFAFFMFYNDFVYFILNYRQATFD